MQNHAAWFHAQPCRDQETCARRQEKQALDSAQWGYLASHEGNRAKLLNGGIQRHTKGTGQTQFSTKFHVTKKTDCKKGNTKNPKKMLKLYILYIITNMVSMRLSVRFYLFKVTFLYLIYLSYFLLSGRGGGGQQRGERTRGHERGRNGQGGQTRKDQAIGTYLGI